MNPFDFMAREHERIALELSRCIDAARSARLTGADRAALRRLGAFLSAQERVVFPALVALARDEAEEPALRGERLKALALAALAQCGDGGRGAPSAMVLLHRAWQAHGAYQHGRMRARFGEIFTIEELRQLDGSMRLEMAILADQRRGGIRRLAQAIGQRLQACRPRSRSRTVPMLRDAVFVYRSAQDAA